jgi:hypothetical protein
LALRNFPQVVASAAIIIVLTVLGDRILGSLQKRAGAKFVETQLMEKK